MNDAQTSGGLLIFVPSERKEKLISALEKEGILAAYIGDVVDGEVKDDKRILVERKMTLAFFLFLWAAGSIVGFFSGLLGIGGAYSCSRFSSMLPPVFGLELHRRQEHHRTDHDPGFFLRHSQRCSFIKA